MRPLTIIITLIAFLYASESYTQPSITHKLNGFRDGDKLYRLIAEPVEQGQRGEKCVWKLPSVKEDGNYVKQSIYRTGDSLTVAEGDFLLHYIATEKEVSMRGFQKRGVCGVQEKLLTELRFPFVYGDSISGNYSRQTTYYDTFVVDGEGTYYTVCDGLGILTDGYETMKDVLRVHHHNNIVSKYNNMNGSETKTIVSEVTEDKYLWYYPGCRYPVMDTRIIQCKSDGKIVSDTIFTSLYLPELQISDLAYDDDNSKLMALKEDLKHYDEHDNNGGFPVKVTANIEPSAKEIRLGYHTDKETDIVFYAHDLAGRLLGVLSLNSIAEGEHHATLILKNRPINNIVMLTVIADGMQQVVKVS